MNRLAVPLRSCPKSNPAARGGKSVRVSRICCFDALSRQTRTVSSPKSRAWTLSTSMAQTKSAFAFGGMHQHGFSRSLTAFFQCPPHRLVGDAADDLQLDQLLAEQPEGPVGLPRRPASNRPASPASPRPRRREGASCGSPGPCARAPPPDRRPRTACAPARPSNGISFDRRVSPDFLLNSRDPVLMAR